MLNQRELDILNILWKIKTPMTSGDIVEQGNRLSQSTVQTVLKKLLNAGLVEVVGSAHSRNVLSRLFSPTEESKKTVANYFVENYKSVENILSAEEIYNAIKSSK